MCISLSIVDNAIILRSWTLTLGRKMHDIILHTLNVPRLKPLILLINQGLLKLHLMLHFLLLIGQNGVLTRRHLGLWLSLLIGLDGRTIE